MTPLEADREWMAYANCVGLENLMFPSADDGAAVQVQVDRAKAVCAGCCVQAECLEYALTNHENWGVWGGKSERERRRMTTQRIALRAS